jgi:hypothetical protein
MLKVSFKEDCQKVQVFNDRATIVTMVGQMTMPHELWAIFPDKIANWMWDHQGVDVQWGNCTKDNEGFRLELSGKSVCANGDTFNAETGRRIAESRAKIRLYKFMYKLFDQLCDYYGKLLVGYKGFNSASINGSLLSELEKYQALWVKESHHLGKLLEDA